MCERYWVIILFESLLKNNINAEESRGCCPEIYAHHFQGANFQQQLPVTICGGVPVGEGLYCSSKSST